MIGRMISPLNFFLLLPRNYRFLENPKSQCNRIKNLSLRQKRSKNHHALNKPLKTRRKPKPPSRKARSNARLIQTKGKEGGEEKETSAINKNPRINSIGDRWRRETVDGKNADNSRRRKKGGGGGGGRIGMIESLKASKNKMHEQKGVAKGRFPGDHPVPRARYAPIFRGASLAKHGGFTIAARFRGARAAN